MGARLARAGVLELLHDNERALQDYDTAVGRAPVCACLSQSRRILVANRQSDRAKSDFDRAIALKPESAEAFFGRANASRQTGSFDDAISDYMRAIELAPDRPDYRAALDDASKIKVDPDLANAEQELLKQKRWIVPQHAESPEWAKPSSPPKFPSPASTSGGSQWPPSGGAPVSAEPRRSPPRQILLPDLSWRSPQALTHAQRVNSPPRCGCGSTDRRGGREFRLVRRTRLHSDPNGAVRSRQGGC